MEHTLSERLREYKKRSHLRESSIDILDRVAHWFIKFYNDMDPREVTFGHIDDYKNWLVKNRSENTANTYLRVFKPFWAWMAKRGHINQDPFDGIRFYKVQEKKFETFNLNEIERLLTISDNLWQTIICLGLCGMRRAEILNLIISDIDFKNNRILISPKKDTSYTWEWQIKDYCQAYVGFDDTINNLLQVQCDLLKETKQPYICLKPKYWERNIALKNQGQLHHSLRNCPWGNFTRDFHGLMKRALVKTKRFHDLRGTFATERYNEGYGIKELQYLMRHSSIQTTARYIHSYDEKNLVAKSSDTFKKLYARKIQINKKTG